MSLHEKEIQPKPIKDTKTDFKLSEYCPFCKLRRKIQRKITKLIERRK